MDHPPKSAPSPHRPSRRVLLVGWDGADWAVIDPLLNDGRLPHLLARLIAAGARGPMTATPPLLSPVSWTTVATGKRPHKHGVVGAWRPRADGRGVTPVGSASRKCKALWQIAGERGLHCHVIGWPATHPAEPIRGVMVSDRYAPALAGTTDPPDPGDAVLPAELARALRPLHLHARDVDFASLEQLVPRARKVDQRRDARLARCAAILAETVTLHAAATFVIEHHRPWGFAAVCYPGIEQFSRAFMAYHPPLRVGIDERDFALFGEVVSRAYAFHDMMLGRLLELAGAETTVLLVSPYGFHHDHRRPDPTAADQSSVAWHRGRGIAVLAGPGVRADCGELIGATTADVTPTVLALLGLPRGRDMDGRVWVEALDAAPVDDVLTWEAGDAGTPASAEPTDAYEQASDESVRHLLALGYAEPPDAEAQRDADDVSARNALNLARAWNEAQRPARAIEILAPFIDRRADLPGLLETYAEAHFRAGRHRELRTLIDQILARRESSAPLAHTGLAWLELEERHADVALEHARLAERQMEQQGAVPSAHALIGRVYGRLGRWDDAQRCFLRVLDVDPEHADALADLAAASLAQRQAAAATEHARRAITLAPDRPLGHYRLGRALLELGRTAEAEAAFHACLARDPDLIAAHRQLAALYGRAMYEPRRQRQHESRVQELLLLRRGRHVWDEADG